MRVAIGSDHRGFRTKETLASHLRSLGHESTDCGCYNEDSVDYPDIAQKVCAAVMSGKSERGILVCGTGIGMSMAANKINGIRAALCHDVFTVERSRLHNDANVLCLGADIVDTNVARQMLEIFLKTPFENGRHSRRVEKIHGLECRTQLDT
ncbi:MAG: ribose 5-phosphate isomerase B [Chloroflexi bacterium]|nr:ribose 5-phosphate isomerase B [Chloroflexota bacterium]